MLPASLKSLKNLASVLGAAAVVLVCAGGAHARGTAAGTAITNRATASYTVGTQPVTATSNTVTITVAQLANVSITWLDGSNVSVASPSSSQILTFKITNTGNGPDTFALGINNSLSGDSFDPAAAAQTYFIDNGNGKYDPGVDLQVTAPVPLAADQNATIFVFNTIPAGQADGAIGNSQLTATSSFGPGTVGTIKPGAGAGGVDVVLALLNGQAAAIGTYQVSTLAVSIVKSSSVKDPYNGTEPIPGATITYTLQVSAVGTGTAKGVVVTDPIPAGTTYKGNSLTLDGKALSDTKDADAGDVSGTPLTATVNLGDLTTATGTRTIIFQALITP